MQDKDYLQQSEEVGFIMSKWWPPPTLNFPYSIFESLYLIASSDLDALLFLSSLLDFLQVVVTQLHIISSWVVRFYWGDIGPSGEIFREEEGIGKAKGSSSER